MHLSSLKKPHHEGGGCTEGQPLVQGFFVKRNRFFDHISSPVSQGVAALCFALASSHALAAGLGAIHVRSYLGEPLRADVDITSLTTEEAEGLLVDLAGADDYQASGLEKNAALAGASVTLQRGPGNKPYLSIRGKHPVQEPFVDLLIKTNSPSGGYGSRGYTVLIDPPTMVTQLRQAAPAPIQAPVVAAPVLSATPALAPIATAAPAVERQEPAVAAAPRKRSAATKQQRTRSAAAAPGSVRVRRGDTAGQIAERLARQQGVSFDQMLAALLRSNQQAFIGGDVNLVRAGTVLQVPSKAEAQSVSRAEAKQEWISSGKNFNQYRSKLAQVQTPAVQQAPAQRAGGKITAETTDQSTSSTAQDKLTVDKMAARQSKVVEGQLRARQLQEAYDRQGELNRNIEELKQLQEAAKASGKHAQAGGQIGATEGPGLEANLPAAATDSAADEAAKKAALANQGEGATVTEVLQGIEPHEAVELVEIENLDPDGVDADVEGLNEGAADADVLAEGNEPAAAVTQAPTLPVAAQEQGESLVDKLKAWSLPLGLGCAGILAAGGLWLARRRKRHEADAAADMAFVESKIEAESYYHAMDQQMPLTETETKGAPSSMVYSPSQLDAAGEIDPVAEAGVYMAYNRDEQAEEILKDAMRQTPSRAAIYTALMEIYARRGDIKALNVVAAEAHYLTGGQGPDWEKAAALGQQADPGNPLYQAGRAAESIPGEDFAVSESSLMPASLRETAPVPLEVAQNEARVEAGDLDFSVAGGLPSGAAPLAPVASFEQTARADLDQMEAAATARQTLDQQQQQAQASSLGEDGFDFHLSGAAEGSSTASSSMDALLSEEAFAVVSDDTGAEGLAFNLDDLSLDITQPPSADLGSDLGLGDIRLDGEEAADLSAWDVKLALANESLQEGDTDAARMFAEEVVAAAPPAIAQQAQALLDRLA